MPFFPKFTMPSYASLVTGVQRNAGPRARPPFVVSHVGFWRPLDFATADAAAASKERTARRVEIDAYLLRILEKIGDALIPEMTPNCIDGEIMLLNCKTKDGSWQEYSKFDKRLVGAFRQVTLVFKWRGALVTLRMQQQTEYSTLTSIIDLSTPLSDDERQSADCSIGCVKAMADALCSLDEKIRRDEVLPPRDYEAEYQAIYSEIWDRFYEEILGNGEFEFMERSLGKIFADFRGCVLGPPGEHGRDQTVAKVGAAFGRPWQGQASHTSFTDRGGRGWRRFPPAKSEKVVRNLWHFLSVAVNGVDLRQHEFTACRMAGGHAIYASSLGAQPLLPRGDERCPIHYLMYCNMRSKWQVGRLIEQICRLGCERLAAVIKFDELRDASYELQVVEAKLTRARDAYDEATRNIKIDMLASEELYKDALRDLRDAVGDIDEQLRQVGRDLGNDISYRIERSQFYIQQFREGVHPLRIRRIEGFLPYDQFVELRLGPTFAYIGALRTQYARIQTYRGALVQRIQDGQSRLVGITARNRNVEIQFLQDVADIALWTALIPYYLGNVLVEHIILPFFEITGGWQKMCIWAYVWALSISLGSVLHVVHALKGGIAKSRVMVVVALWTALAVGSVAFIAIGTAVVFFDSSIGVFRNPHAIHTSVPAAPAGHTAGRRPRV